MSTGQLLGGGLGAVIGAILAAPTGGMSLAGGALLGAQVGMAAGGYLDPPKGPTVYGPRLDDKSIQTSTYGTMLPRFYGTIAVSGNLTWLENNQLKETVRKKKQGGKGGGSKTTVKTYSYSATFILSLGIGPIAGVRRIWCADKLIYNAGSDDLETIIASNQNAAGFKVYLGSDDQLPDPRYEADVGVGNAPAYRGEAYLAFYDFQLADFSNTLQGAQFKVEVVKAKADEAIASSGALPELGGWTDMESFKGRYYAVSSLASNFLITSYDGEHWDQQALPSSRALFSIRSNGSRLVALSNDGNLLTSTDGTNWAGFPLPANASFEALIWTGAEFCAVGSNSSVSMVSANGLDWTVGTLPASRNWRAVAWSGSLYCAVADGSQYGAISSDGLSWTEIDLGVSRLWSGVAWHAGQFLAIARLATDFAVSGNGTTWTSIPSPTADAWANLGVNSDGFVMLAHGTQVARSDDGASWTVGAVPSENWSCLLLQGTAFYSVAPGVKSLRGFFRLVSDSVPLQDLILDEIALSSLLTPADADVSLITDQVRGYRVSGGSIRSALEPLQGTWPFDMIQSGYQLKPVPRGQASAMTIPWQDLGATDGDSPGDLLQESREMDSQLPARTSIKYLDASREYAIAEQSASRDNTPAINRVDRELPIVLTADEAAGVADVLQNLAWLERSEYSFSLPPTYLALEPADAVTIEATWATFELRITEINYAPDGRLECKARPNRAALYTSNAKGGEGVPPSGTVPLAGPSVAVLLDIPVVDETLQDDPGFATAVTGRNTSWPGAVLFRSADGGQTWVDLQAYQGKATLGTARAALSANSGALIDQGSVLTVDLLSGELESVTQAQMLAGANFAAYGADGRWEIIRFQNATLQGDGSYQLTQLVRGDKGTEWATGLHQSGDTFVLLDDPDNAFVGSAVETLGLERTYRPVTSGQSIDAVADQVFTYRGVNLRPLSPAYPVGLRNGSGDLAASVTRRSRLSSSWWITGVSAPLGETTEAYEWEVMNGATVKRTISSTSPAITYTAADQVTDFGSAQAAITFRIYQLSSVVGRGYPLETTL